MGKERRVIRFFGTVQGVGFRYMTCLAASTCDVNGYVKNMPDGSVECILEGESNQIDACLAELESRTGRYIRRRKQHSEQFTGEFPDFGVRY
ncbi:MAG: acylphosphatase [Planctomycetes bacterium]|nr:acylphosphatase [Planctomycetota bacterium]